MQIFTIEGGLPLTDPTPRYASCSSYGFEPLLNFLIVPMYLHESGVGSGHPPFDPDSTPRHLVPYKLLHSVSKLL